MQSAMTELENAQRRVQELIEANRPAVLAEVKAKILRYRLTAAELGFHAADVIPLAQLANGPGSQAPVLAKKGDKRSNVAPKYVGPKGERWSGRGKLPKWLSDLIMAGRSKEEFYIQPPPADSNDGGNDGNE